MCKIWCDISKNDFYDAIVRNEIMSGSVTSWSIVSTFCMKEQILS